MSRIGKRVINVPSSVSCSINGGSILIKGPRGTLSRECVPGVAPVLEGTSLRVEAAPGISGAFLGLENALINNMVIGVTTGFEITLILKGTGYRASVAGNKLELKIMKSHPVIKSIPEGITVSVEKNVTIKVSGNDKQQVGEFAANIKRERPVEPYKGKGIYRDGEFIRRKEGKKSKK